MIGNLPYGKKKKTCIIIITKVVGNSGIRAFSWTFSADQRIRENCERVAVYSGVDLVLNDFFIYLIYS